MPAVERIVFRKLTGADFFNINKPRGTEERGGGQSYIDIPVNAVAVSDWKDFFENIGRQDGDSGPRWIFSIHSLGVAGTQQITIAQRRQATVSIRSQKLDSGASNRVSAWHPARAGFPKPRDPNRRERANNLCIYIARLGNGEYWAGWFQKDAPEPAWDTNQDLNRMFRAGAGYLKFRGDIIFDHTDSAWPFRKATRHRRKIADTNYIDEDQVSLPKSSPKIKYSVREVRRRNANAAIQLKKLYEGRCQISGTKYTFKDTSGKYYSEAHHLIPLGEGGADSVRNMVILSPLIHRMMHHAIVGEIDLGKIENNTLPITINGKKHVITWHPEHAKIVRAASD